MDNYGALVLFATLSTGLILAAVSPNFAVALGEETRLDVRAIDYQGGNSSPHPSAPRRLGWEVRKRTSIETRLSPTRTTFSDPSIYGTPLLYWAGDSEFDPLRESDVVGFRRFVEQGGFVLIDDADRNNGGFDRSIRREVARAFSGSALQPLSSSHTIYRSFYLLNGPVGRIEGPDHLLSLSVGDRTAVVYTQHDLGGAFARDNLGTWQQQVIPGGEQQRELAMRLGVNLVMYALCLDYKDEQVHAPFIMRRRGGGPPQ